MIDRSGSVYVISGDIGLKVGFSRLPENRAIALGQKSEKKYKVLYKTPMYECASRIEAEAHRLLAWARLHPRQEWFDVTLHEAMEAINKAIELIGPLTSEDGRDRLFHVRLDEKAWAAVEAIRRAASPIPSVSEVLRQAVVEKAEREAKASSRK